MKKRNPVAKHARKFNRAAVMTDRKQSAKAGYQKHKGEQTVSIDIQHNYLVIYHFANYDTSSFPLQFNLFNPSDEDVEIAIEKRFRREAADNLDPEEGYEVYSDLVFKLEIIEGRAVATYEPNISAYIDHQPSLEEIES